MPFKLQTEIIETKMMKKPSNIENHAHVSICIKIIVFIEKYSVSIAFVRIWFFFYCSLFIFYLAYILR